MQSYLEQLQKLADGDLKRLKMAFLEAGVTDSTFYRVLHGQDLRHDTASKVARALGK